MTTKTRTIAYIRVSTLKQVDSGISLESQEEKARAYASLYDLDICEVIIDAGESAKTLDRPGLQRALAMLKSGQADALLVVKLDRLTRSVKDLGELIERYFSPGQSCLLSVSEQIDTRTPGGRLVLNILASVSQWEREVIAERTQTAILHKQANGEYIGGNAPYGFRIVDGIQIEDEFEQDVIRQAKELHEDGMSLRKIAVELQSRGFNARNGIMFQATQIKRMVA